MRKTLCNKVEIRYFLGVFIIFQKKMIFLKNKCKKIWKIEKNVIIFASQLTKAVNSMRGLVVQLVRIRACHARGRGFESRPDRKKKVQRSNFVGLFLFTD